MDAIRSHLKNVFQPNICVGSAFQILDISNICLRFEMLIRLDLEPESYFSDGFYKKREKEQQRNLPFLA